MKDREPTLESLALGAVLGQVMRDAGLNRTQMARLLGRSPGWVSRLVSGKRGGYTRDIVAVLDVCDVPGERRAEIMAMALPCGFCGCRNDHSGLERETRSGGGAFALLVDGLRYGADPRRP